MAPLESTALSTTPVIPPASSLGTAFASKGPNAIRDTAREFESLMLSMLIKEMREASGKESFFPGDTGDIHGGLFDLFMGKHLADAGGIGLAQQITRQLELTANLKKQPDDANLSKQSDRNSGAAVSGSPGP